MKNFFDWIKRNISTLFSIIGIVVTIYFAVFYVPDYLREAKLEKVRNINTSLIETVQELIYNDQELQIADLEVLIKGKEIKYGVTYPYSADELLVQVQEGFYENKFIPLDKRKNLSDKITSLRSQIKPPEDTDNKSRKNDLGTELISWGIAILGVIASLIGFYVMYLKSREEKEIELEQEVELKADQIERSIKTGFQYEKYVGEALAELNLKYESQSGHSDQGYDFLVELKNSKVLIEVKYARHMISMPAISQALIAASMISGNLILISNVPLTKRNGEFISKFTAENNIKFYSIVSDSKEEIKNQLKQIIRELS